MKVLDQKLGTVGDITVNVTDGKLVVAVEGDVDLVAQLTKLQAAHSTGLLGSLLGAAAAVVKSLTATPVAPPPAPPAA